MGQHALGSRVISNDTMWRQGRSQSGSQQAWNNSVKNAGRDSDNGIKSVHSVNPAKIRARGVHHFGAEQHEAVEGRSRWTCHL